MNASPQAGQYSRRSALVLALAAMLRPALVWAAPKTHTIHMDGTSYSPQSLTVRRGDRVVWVNEDPFPHTVTAKSKSFDSGSIGPKASWTYHADKAGTFDYLCRFHPTMTGTLTVR